MKILLTDKEIEVALKPVYDEILASGELLEIAPLLNRAVAKAQIKKVVEWSEGSCFHASFAEKRRRCATCWQALKKEAGL